ncbi:hypothetical protein SAM_0135 [Streptococcus agalactiae CJB111]|nr:hypothetical protein SAL_0162 [Streptococcus agalactiae 515]EAO73114.1 hypothetical protein SAM_0135 [Streptococcus agalactiae CJB111]
MKNNVVTTKERNIAKPPLLGIGTLLILRAFGLSTAPTFKDITRIIGVRMIDNKNAPINTKIYSIVKGIILSHLNHL